MSKVRVWDLPTRVFHWGLVFCVIGLVITGEVAGGAMEWHFRLGYATLTLLLFRLFWGFMGGHWSRFATFIPSPATLISYVKGTPRGAHSVGHNPLGALSVLALLFATFLQTCFGMMSDDEITATGPLVSKIPGAWTTAATFLHTEVTKVVLIVLVLLHIAAILWYRLKKGDNLIRPMLSGDKEIDGQFIDSKDNTASRTLAVVILLLCSSAVGLLLRWAA